MIQKLGDDRPILLVDMDNTLNKFWVEFEKSYNFHYAIKNPEEHISISREGLKVYETLKNCLPTATEELRFQRRDKVFNSIFFWRDQTPYEDIKEVVSLLYKKYNTYIITIPWTSARECYREKVEWIQRELPFFDTAKIIFIRDKRLVMCDYIIDDAPVNLDRNDCKTIAMDYEYNRHIQTDFRADNWNDIGKFLGVL